LEGGIVESQSEVSAPKPHDEAFKKLMQEFFFEFLELFFPQLYEQLDRGQSNFLMQELLVDVVGGKRKTLDLLVDTKRVGGDVNVLVHLEPQSTHQNDFATRMLVYYGRLYELFRLKHQAIIPIAVFTHSQQQDEPDTIEMGLPEIDILRFRFLKLQLRQHDWHKYVDSDNPVAAATLAQMDVKPADRRELRKHFLLMMIRLKRKYNEAQLALISSYADLYYEPTQEEDEQLLREIATDKPEEGAILMELMPAWKRWGYEEGIEKGIVEGIEKGIEKGLETGKRAIALNLLTKGMSIPEVSEVTQLNEEVVQELQKTLKQ
jgi:predicted transposase/invertase (TIGR01784 family)